jgi:hypothetical protein
MTLEEKVRANSEFVVNDLGRKASDLGESFGYNRDSVEFVEGYIERTKQRRASQEQIDSLVQVLGSFLGECIRHAYGGEWREYEGNPGIFFENGTAAFPFNKVGMQFKNGLPDSILGFFDVIPKIKGGEITADDDGDGGEVSILEVDEPRRTPGGHRLK